MKKEIEDIRDALVSIDAYDDSTREALASLEEALDEIDRHPKVDEVRDAMRETAARVREGGSAEEGPSGRWQALREHLDEWEKHHPRVTVVVGKVADAFAAVGL